LVVIHCGDGRNKLGGDQLPARNLIEGDEAKRKQRDNSERHNYKTVLAVIEKKLEYQLRQREDRIKGVAQTDGIGSSNEE